MTAKECVRVTGELFLLFETHGALLQWVRIGEGADAFGVRLTRPERTRLAEALDARALPWRHPGGRFEVRAAEPGLILLFRGPGAGYQGQDGTLALGELAAERLRAALAGELGGPNAHADDAPHDGAH